MVTASGYDVSRWRDILLRLGQTKVYFTTTATLPYKSKFNTPDYLLVINIHYISQKCVDNCLLNISFQNHGH
jgi:hypothetical protein